MTNAGTDILATYLGRALDIGKVARNALIAGGSLTAGYTGLQFLRALTDDRPGGLGEGDLAHPPSDVTLGRSLKSDLPAPLRTGVDYWDAAISAAARGVEQLVSGRLITPDAGDTRTPLEQARASWDALDANHAVRGADGRYREVRDNPMRLGTAWGFSQALHASLTLAMVSGDYSAVPEHVRGVENFAQGIGFAPGPGPGGSQDRYFDDNAWLGLAYVQGYLQTGDRELLTRAERVARFIEQGTHPDGGVQWVENDPLRMRPTAANGPALELELRLYQATGDKHHLEVAHGLDAFLTKQLRRPDGLYDDNVNDAGRVDHATYSYNQGTPIGADVLWYQITGDDSRLDRAEQTARAAIDWLKEDDRLWKHAPAFNAIFFRNLLALDAVRPNPQYRTLLAEYVDRAWREARHPKTGLFTEGGIGSYERQSPSGLLDQSAFVQMQAMLAVPRERAAQLT